MNTKDKFTIKSTKQENGLWGMPLQCVSIDKLIFPDEENWTKHSAICIAIAECYPNETFSIHFSSKEGFFVKLSESGFKNIKYEDYILNNNVITYIGKWPKKS